MPVARFAFFSPMFLFISAAYQDQLNGYLEEREIALRKERESNVAEVRETLLAQMGQPKNDALLAQVGVDADPVDPDACGLSSVQVLAGEDGGRGERVRSQQDQMRRWCAERVRERWENEVREAEEEEAYVDYVLNEDAARVDAEREQATRRLDLNRSIHRENMELAEEARLRRERDDDRDREAAEKEVRTSQASHLLTEDTDFAKSAVASHRYRPDHFKGLSRDQIQEMYDENANVMDEKTWRRDEEVRSERAWAEHQSGVVQKLEEAEIERRHYAAEQNRALAEELDRQRVETRAKREHMRKENFGAIGEGSFQKFGTSCR